MLHDLQSQIRDHGIAPHLALIAVQLIFGTWPIVGKVALRAMSSSGLVAFRVAGAAIVFILLQGKLGELRKLPQEISQCLPLQHAGNRN